ncbi:MAG: hypothetical protein IAF58_15350 [Leptolyngbya sp.]|nr:hypothetical protein [Candidatus Melainabacteria bacterium]
MSGRERQVDNVTERLNRAPAGQDLRELTQEVSQLQRNPALWQAERQRINESVDMSRFGFARGDDVQIMGVERGQLVTRSSDGRTEQVRDNTGRVTRERAVTPGADTANPNGNRQFRENADGSAQYAIRPGDTMTGVAQERLTRELGRAPNGSEISRAVQEYARVNNISDVNRVAVGRELRLPPSNESMVRERDRQTGTPGIRPDNTALSPADRTYHPLNVPGQVERERNNGGDFRESATRNNDRTERVGNRDVRSYETSLNTGLISRETAQVREETDPRTGAMLRSRVSYGGNGIDFSVRTDDGNRQTLTGVRQVESVLDPASGGYSTTLTLGDGSRHQMTTDREGRVADWRAVPARRAAAVPVPGFSDPMTGFRY